MRHFITAAVLTVATLTGVQAKPPSGGNKGSFSKPTIAKNFDSKHSSLKQVDAKVGSGIRAISSILSNTSSVRSRKFCPMISSAFTQPSS